MLRVDRFGYKASISWQNCPEVTSCQAASKREGFFMIIRTVFCSFVIFCHWSWGVDWNCRSGHWQRMKKTWMDIAGVDSNGGNCRGGLCRSGYWRNCSVVTAYNIYYSVIVHIFQHSRVISHMIYQFCSFVPFFIRLCFFSGCICICVCVSNCIILLPLWRNKT